MGKNSSSRLGEERWGEVRWGVVKWCVGAATYWSLLAGFNRWKYDVVRCCLRRSGGGIPRAAQSHTYSGRVWTSTLAVLKMIRTCVGALLTLLALISLGHCAPSTGLARGYLPPPPAAPTCEVVIKEVEKEEEVEECSTVEEEECVTSLVDVCEDQQTEKCDSVTEQVCTTVEAGLDILTKLW